MYYLTPPPNHNKSSFLVMEAGRVSREIVTSKKTRQKIRSADAGAVDPVALIHSVDVCTARGALIVSNDTGKMFLTSFLVQMNLFSLVLVPYHAQKRFLHFYFVDIAPNYDESKTFFVNTRLNIAKAGCILISQARIEHKPLTIPARGERKKTR